ncbi:hypothetical protein NC653_023136 [Populus alba x Populus x berolinensis]|uniref:UDP-glucosyltransferase n=1 Tax=Populus alba x Populus x berolinensis TaxID=444605 RepID=A0AAD6QAH7_9ROSI|nr:hypothetical protein NC653_023136 [Populus alba x Populus x berolinensis]
MDEIASVGGFWTHCGWNSSLEAVFAGIPLLALPLFFDQVPNSKQIVENWRIGWQMKKDEGTKILVKGEELQRLCKGLWIRRTVREGYEKKSANASATVRASNSKRRIF